jgi:PAS domain S-box-containing protein
MKRRGSRPAPPRARGRVSAARSRPGSAPPSTPDHDFRELFDNASDIVFTIDMAERFTWINRAASLATGYGIEDAGTLTVSRIVAPEHLTHARAKLVSKLGGAGPTRYELDIVAKDGRRIPLELSTRLIMQGGRAVGIQGIAHDITERRQAEARSRRDAERTRSLLSVASRMTLLRDRDAVLRAVCEEATRALAVPVASLSLYDPMTDMLCFAHGIGLPSWFAEQVAPMPRAVYESYVRAQGPVVIVPDVRALRDLPNTALYESLDIRTTVNVRIAHQERLIGRLNIGTIGASRVFTEDDLRLLQGIADQAALAITNATLFSDLTRANADLVSAYDKTLEGWSRALELRDWQTHGHTQRVVGLTLRLAEEVGVPESQRPNLRRGALLHDIGKMGIPDEVLLKRGPLTATEWEIMRRHPQYAYDLLSAIPYLRPMVEIPYAHHERWNGSGYPRGLRGDSIPIGARVFAVADVWDALRSDRPYRPAWPEPKAETYIVEQAGVLFDPAVVAAFQRQGRAGTVSDC